MQSNNPFFDDLARLASGAVGNLAGLRQEFEQLARQQMERVAGEMGLVSREEFEAVEAMARLAREENESLAARVAALEAEVEKLKAKPTGAAKRTSKAKPASAKAKSGESDKA